MIPMPRRNLLLCFDAFGTLFKPRRPIAVQYREIARECGLDGFSDEQLQHAFRAAFKSEAKTHPNYGRASGMGAEKWWTNVITKTFQPLLAGQSLPTDLAPKLLHRFSSDKGYSFAPELPEVLKSLKQPQHQHPRKRFDKIVVGVITNSDDRVPGILSSFGLNVSPLRFGSHGTTPVNGLKDQYDIDFHCMSYDVGFEKPDTRIFVAAESMLKRVISAQRDDEVVGGHNDLSSWIEVYVGDEYDKDVVGALGAGWNAVLLNDGGADQGLSIRELENSPTKSLDDVFSGTSTLSVKSIRSLGDWLLARD
ncbi:putative haloacid dehalogenase protein [Diplogelasinospora grovesii]|uniref:Haloacid dehalogenase protein n=1 Tax=Diplogelasinospora grovesii TaxID=303347 RepID=A0AAN6N3B1_9PEZI|nr:putative haloacid dehalogenase protein [Diplogelasinospora grovesii]